MNRLVDRARQEEGAVLLIALGFLTFIGVVAAVLLSYTTASIRDTDTVRDIRSREYGADGVVELAINKVRSTTALSNTSGCAAATLNGVSLRADCSDPAGTALNVTITACPATAPAGCPGQALLVAVVQYTRPTPPAVVTVAVTSWSARR